MSKTVISTKEEIRDLAPAQPNQHRLSRTCRYELRTEAGAGGKSSLISLSISSLKLGLLGFLYFLLSLAPFLGLIVYAHEGSNSTILSPAVLIQ